MCSRISGYFSDVTDEELHGDLELVTVDAMSAALEAMISSTSPDPSGNLTDECKETMKNLGELTSRAAEVGVASLEGDLATLSALLGNAPGIEDQRAAVGKLEKQADDHDYSGILKLMSSSPQWPAILAWAAMPSTAMPQTTSPEPSATRSTRSRAVCTSQRTRSF